MTPSRSRPFDAHLPGAHSEPQESGEYAIGTAATCALDVFERNAHKPLHKQLIRGLCSATGAKNAFCFAGRALVTRAMFGSNFPNGLGGDTSEPLLLGPIPSGLTSHAVSVLEPSSPGWQEVTAVLGGGLEGNFIVCPLGLDEMVEGFVGVVVPPGTPVDLRPVRLIGPVLNSLFESFLARRRLERYRELSCSTRNVSGLFCLIEHTLKQLIWCGTFPEDPALEAQAFDEGPRLVRAVLSMLEAPSNEGPVSAPQLGLGSLVRVERPAALQSFGRGSFVAAVIQPYEARRRSPVSLLSRRERQIARLLIAGYTGINAAAILGVTENTMRTYVKRLYTKLGVSSRSELTRKIGTELGMREP